VTSIHIHALILGIALQWLPVAVGDSPFDNPHAEIQSRSILGCNATGCHGSNVPESKNWQRAFKIWFDQDPHAQSYTSLLSPTSVGIVSRLANEDLKPDSKQYRDILNAKCISCHTNENTSEKEQVLGVDCQSCHGPADAWGSEHYSSKWKELGKDRFENTRMLNVESMVTRAQICSSCHIGEVNRTSGSDREVDHQMMAAGHPPMHFDFESYLRRYPAHWDSENESVGLKSIIGTQRWRIGKISSMMAKLDLLSARALRSEVKSAQKGDWPELTDLSCSSCHHALGEPNWRQDRAFNSTASLDDWFVSQLDCAVREPSTEELNAQLTSLKRQVEHVSPDPRLVAMRASSLRHWLAAELDYMSSADEHSEARIREKLDKRLASVDQIRNWESATQWYISTRVLSEGLGMESTRKPLPFFVEDPFLGTARIWKPSSDREFTTPRMFHPEMLDTYMNDLKQQLRSRP